MLGALDLVKYIPKLMAAANGDADAQAALVKEFAPHILEALPGILAALAMEAGAEPGTRTTAAFFTSTSADGKPVLMARVMLLDEMDELGATVGTLVVRDVVDRIYRKP